MNKSILVLLSLLLFSCATYKSYETHRVSEHFTVRLDNQGVGGYRWFMESNPLISIQTEKDSTYQVEGNVLSSNLKIFELKAEKRGRTKLVFVQKRTFEPDSLIPTENHLIKKIKIKK